MIDGLLNLMGLVTAAQSHERWVSFLLEALTSVAARLIAGLRRQTRKYVPRGMAACAQRCRIDRAERHHGCRAARGSQDES
jgi:hypothetical protein